MKNQYFETVEKRYYTISEVAEICNISDTVIRDICKDYGINPKRNKNDYRKFTPDEVETIKAIAQVRRLPRYALEKKIMILEFPQNILKRIEI